MGGGGEDMAPWPPLALPMVKTIPHNIEPRLRYMNYFPYHTKEINKVDTTLNEKIIKVKKEC